MTLSEEIMKLVGPISFVTKMKKDSGVLLSGKRSMVLQTQEIQVYKCQHTQRSLPVPLNGADDDFSPNLVRSAHGAKVLGSKICSEKPQPGQKAAIKPLASIASKSGESSVF